MLNCAQYNKNASNKRFRTPIRMQQISSSKTTQTLKYSMTDSLPTQTKMFSHKLSTRIINMIMKASEDDLWIKRLNHYYKDNLAKINLFTRILTGRYATWMKKEMADCFL